MENADKLQKELINKILLASNKIHEKSRTSSSNYIVCSSEFGYIIEDINRKEIIRKERNKKINKLLE